MRLKGDNYTIEGNTCNSNEGRGIWLGGSEVTNSVVENNVLNDNNVGILLWTCHNSNLTGNTINSNTRYGIEVASDSPDNSINFNNIVGNGLYGVINEGTTQVDAEHNWWGHASGPSGVGPGTGDAVTDNVDYDPWLSSEVEGSKSETVDGSGTVDATGEADISVYIDATGNHTVTCVEYTENPDSAFSNEIGKYYDVSIDNDTNVGSLTIKFYYTDADIAGRVESSLTMKYWDKTTSTWKECSLQTLHTDAVNGYSGYIEITITALSEPNLNYLANDPPFGPAGNPTPGKPVGGEVFLVDKLALLAPYIAAILAVVATGAIIIKKRRY